MGVSFKQREAYAGRRSRCRRYGSEAHPEERRPRRCEIKLHVRSGGTPGINLLDKLWKAYDQPGKAECAKYDFKSNLLESKRQFAIEYKQTIDWNVTDTDSLLQTEEFITATNYDALNRATNIKTSHNAQVPASEILPGYDEGGMLNAVNVKLRGSSEPTAFVANINYNPKSQRERIQYGNGATTGYSYDEKTFRLKRLLTTRNNGADKLQDLNYTYDPVGNITQIVDNAQQALFFNGSEIKAIQKFEYDALYRLIEATGREHVSMGADSEPEIEGYNPAQISPEDGSAMRNYTREWEYDQVGNILAMIHNANANSWTRNYSYATDSNRLNGTTVGQTTLNYTYNENGSMATMPHLQAMEWDFAERLAHITRGTTEAYYNYDGAGQRARKVVEKGGIVEERLYLGGFEIFRKKVNGSLDMERETLHVMDDQKRIAVVETLTVDNGNAIANPQPATNLATIWNPHRWNWTKKRTSSATRSITPTGIPVTVRAETLPKPAKNATDTQARRRTRNPGYITLERDITLAGWDCGQLPTPRGWWMERICTLIVGGTR